MSLLLKLHLFFCAANWAELLHTLYVLLPALTLLILFMKTQSTQSVTRLLAEHGEYGALTSWHNRQRI